MSAQTVVVGCKLPHGLHLDVRGKPRVTLNGMNSAKVIGGHGITHNVDKETFDMWMKLNHKHPAVARGLIFAHDRQDNVEAEALEKEGEKTGFEGLDQANPIPGIEEATDTPNKRQKGGKARQPNK